MTSRSERGDTSKSDTRQPPFFAPPAWMYTSLKNSPLVTSYHPDVVWRVVLPGHLICPERFSFGYGIYANQPQTPLLLFTNALCLAAYECVGSKAGPQDAKHYMLVLERVAINGVPLVDMVAEPVSGSGVPAAAWSVWILPVFPPNTPVHAQPDCSRALADELAVRLWGLLAHGQHDIVSFSEYMDLPPPTDAFTDDREPEQAPRKRKRGASFADDGSKRSRHGSPTNSVRSVDLAGPMVPDNDPTTKDKPSRRAAKPDVIRPPSHPAPLSFTSVTPAVLRHVFQSFIDWHEPFKPKEAAPIPLARLPCAAPSSPHTLSDIYRPHDVAEPADSPPRRSAHRILNFSDDEDDEGAMIVDQRGENQDWRHDLDMMDDDPPHDAIPPISMTRVEEIEIDMQAHDPTWLNMFSVSYLMTQDQKKLDAWIREGQTAPGRGNIPPCPAPPTFGMHPFQYTKSYVHDGVLQLCQPDCDTNAGPVCLMVCVSRLVPIPARLICSCLDLIVLPGYRSARVPIVPSYIPFNLDCLARLNTVGQIEQLNRTPIRLQRIVKYMNTLSGEYAMDIYAWATQYYSSVMAASGTDGNYWMVDGPSAGAIADLDAKDLHCESCPACQSLLSPATLLADKISPLEALVYVSTSRWAHLGQTHSFGLMVTMLCGIIGNVAVRTPGIRYNVMLVGPNSTGKSATLERLLSTIPGAMYSVMVDTTEAFMTIGTTPWKGINPSPPITVHPWNSKVAALSDPSKSWTARHSSSLKSVTVEGVIRKGRGTYDKHNDKQLGVDEPAMLCRCQLILCTNHLINDDAPLASRFTPIVFTPPDNGSEARGDACDSTGRAQMGPVGVSWPVINMEALTSEDVEFRDCVARSSHVLFGRCIRNFIVCSYFISAPSPNLDVLRSIICFDMTHPVDERQYNLASRVFTAVQTTAANMFQVSMMLLAYDPSFACLSQLQLMATAFANPVSFEAVMFAITANPVAMATEQVLDAETVKVLEFLLSRIDCVEGTPIHMELVERRPYVPLTLQTGNGLRHDLRPLQGSLGVDVASNCIARLYEKSMLYAKIDPATRKPIPHLNIHCLANLAVPFLTVWTRALREILVEIWRDWDLNLKNPVIKRLLDKHKSIKAPLLVVTINKESYYLLFTPVHRRMGFPSDNHAPDAVWEDLGVSLTDWTRATTVLTNRDTKILHPKLTANFNSMKGVADLFSHTRPPTFDLTTGQPRTAHSGPSPIQAAIAVSELYSTDYNSERADFKKTADAHRAERRAQKDASADAHRANAIPTQPTFPPNTLLKDYPHGLSTDFFFVKQAWADALRLEANPATSAVHHKCAHMLAPGYLRPTANHHPEITTLTSHGDMLRIPAPPGATYTDVPLWLHNFADGNRAHPREPKLFSPLPASIFTNCLVIQLHDHWRDYSAILSMLHVFKSHVDPIGMITAPMIIGVVPIHHKRPKWPAQPTHLARVPTGVHSSGYQVLADIDNGRFVLEVYMYNLLCTVHYLCNQRGHNLAKVCTTRLLALGEFHDMLVAHPGLEQVYRLAAATKFKWESFLIPWPDAKPVDATASIPYALPRQ